MALSGSVRTVEVDDTGCGWVDLDLALRVGDQTCTECSARIAVPVTADDNPWDRRSGRWLP
jgi:hypothetical protein